MWLQVPTLVDAATTSPGKPPAKGISKAPAPAKPSPGPSAVAAAAAAASSALSVVHETAAGYNLYCPAGLYQLSLKHPAAKHLFDQLLWLRTYLQQLQQQAKAEQLLQQQAAAAAAAAAAASAGQDGGLAGAPLRAGAPGSRAQSRRVSRANSPVPAPLEAHTGDAASNRAGVHWGFLWCEWQHCFPLVLVTCGKSARIAELVCLCGCMPQT